MSSHLQIKSNLLVLQHEKQNFKEMASNPQIKYKKLSINENQKFQFSCNGKGVLTKYDLKMEEK